MERACDFLLRYSFLYLILAPSLVRLSAHLHLMPPTDTYVMWKDSMLGICVLLRISSNGAFLLQACAYQQAWSPGPGPAPAPGITLGLQIGDTAGLAALTDSITLTQPKSPIVLLHGAIQGGWVWNYSRPEVGAPLVRACRDSAQSVSKAAVCSVCTCESHRFSTC